MDERSPQSASTRASLTSELFIANLLNDQRPVLAFGERSTVDMTKADFKISDDVVGVWVVEQPVADRPDYRQRLAILGDGTVYEGGSKPRDSHDRSRVKDDNVRSQVSPHAHSVVLTHTNR